MNRIASLLVVAVGNPARGDDGLGPALAERLDREGLEDVVILVDFQLQVEHALDLAGREAVLFIDASRAPVDVALGRVAPAEALPALSHALTPAGVLHVARRLGQPLPEAWQLAIEGAGFGLGEGLSEVARERLPRALAVACGWWRARGLGADGVRSECGRQDGHRPAGAPPSGLGRPACSTPVLHSITRQKRGSVKA